MTKDLLPRDVVCMQYDERTESRNQKEEEVLWQRKGTWPAISLSFLLAFSICLFRGATWWFGYMISFGFFFSFSFFSSFFSFVQISTVFSLDSHGKDVTKMHINSRSTKEQTSFRERSLPASGRPAYLATAYLCSINTPYLQYWYELTYWTRRLA